MRMKHLLLEMKLSSTGSLFGACRPYGRMRESSLGGTPGAPRVVDVMHVAESCCGAMLLIRVGLAETT
ncbi:hypothetical protein J2W54_001600 [Rhodococcus fascians]|nr:hypothetical protein [Rhodococcus sp. 3258]MDR6931224.1 hypothetical protein [Rhodococcus fascians]